MRKSGIRMSMRNLLRIDAKEHSKRVPARRGRPPSLSEHQIVESAVHLARSVPLETVSMRQLAGELGVPVMTIYNYVPNKEVLYDLVVSAVLRDVRIPSPDEGTWEDRLKQLERNARNALAGFRGLSVDRGDSTEGTRLAEGVMSILASAGFTSTESSLAFAALFTFMVGQLDIDVEIAEAGGPAAAAVQGASRVTHMTPDEIFEFGFDAVIEGLKVKLGPRPRATGATRKQKR
jgi:TetR/AcrR family tetracycline transcriptional repressor